MHYSEYLNICFCCCLLNQVLQKDGQWQAVASAFEIRQAVMNDCEKKVMDAR